MFPGVDSRIVIIRPVDTETVIADQVVIPYTDRIGNRVRIEQAFTGQFMNTGGASTGDPEIPVAEMLSTFVTPENFESMLSIEEIDRSRCQGLGIHGQSPVRFGFVELIENATKSGGGRHEIEGNSNSSYADQRRLFVGGEGRKIAKIFLQSFAFGIQNLLIRF